LELINALLDHHHLIFDVAQKASKVADPQARFEIVDLLILLFLNLKP